MKTYTLASTFLYDHINRDLLSAETIQGSKGRSLLVNLTEDEYGELLSDAKFYAENGGDFGPEFNPLMRSAAATVRALVKQGGPE
jgi:hypothetical protein